MVAVAILAAGKGTRMKSKLPKVLHPLGGRSLVEWVLTSLIDIQPQHRLVIVGYQGEQVRSTLKDYPDVVFVEQTEQKGTAMLYSKFYPT